MKQNMKITWVFDQQIRKHLFITVSLRQHTFTHPSVHLTRLDEIARNPCDVSKKDRRIFPRSGVELGRFDNQHNWQSNRKMDMVFLLYLEDRTFGYGSCLINLWQRQRTRVVGR